MRISFACFLGAVVLAGCGLAEDNRYGLVPDLRRDAPPERTWIEAEAERLASLSSGADYTLYDPNALEIGADGRIYVYDYGENKVKAFTAEGEFVTTYGRGQGRGPGQMMSITDMGVWRDSLVYVVDSRQRRVSYFGRSDGDFVQSENYEVPVTRFARTGRSNRYIEAGIRGRSDYFIIATSDNRTTAPRFLSSDVPAIALDGELHADENRATYVPYYLPLILTYSPEDTTGTAYPTPDFGAPRPKTREARGGTFAPANQLNGNSSQWGRTLSVRRPGTDSLEFDLYRTDEMSYQYTARFPIEAASPAMYAENLIAIARDTTVTIYVAEPPSDSLPAE